MMMEKMATSISNRWWVLVLDGVLAIIFGVIAWVWPGLTVLTLVTLFGAYALVTGVVRLFTAYHARREGHSPWLFVFQGLLGIVTGIIVFVWPGISALALLYVIGAWAIVTGVSEIVAAVSMRRVIDNEWFLGLAGAASILFGVLVIIFPGAGAVGLVWAIGLYAIFFGVMLIALGIRLRGLGHPSAPAAA
jgi:uncharacterized membrane protein HdeD (DUF308 family)